MDSNRGLRFSADALKTLQQIQKLCTRDEDGFWKLKPQAAPTLEEICDGMDIDRSEEWVKKRHAIEEAAAFTPQIPRR